jgi:hypothetical protein
MQTRIAAAVASILAAAALLPDGAPAQPAQGQPLAQAMVGSWAVGSVDKCASAPYRVTLDGGTIVFRDHAGKVTRERIEAASPTAMVTRVEENQPGKPVAVWNYERKSADMIAVTNTTTRRAFTIHRCEEPAVAQQGQGDVKVGFLAGRIQTFDGRGGCTYVLEADDRRRRGPNDTTPFKPVAASAYDDPAELVVNIDGRDMLAKPARRTDTIGGIAFDGSVAGYTVRIPDARLRSCGHECGKATTRLEISKGGARTTLAVVGYC